MIDLEQERKAFEAEWLNLGGHLNSFQVVNKMYVLTENVQSAGPIVKELSERAINSAFALWLIQARQKNILIDQLTADLEKAQSVPETHVLVEKKNTEDWYLDDDEYIWLDHDGIDGTLCELGIGKVQPVKHKEYLITQSNTLYAARVWDGEDDHIAWKLFESEEAALEAAKYCKQMYDASESGAEQ